MIISVWQEKKSTYLENTTYYYYSFEYKFYNGYKTTCVNTFVTIITLPFDIIHFLGGYILSKVFLELPQIIVYSPYLIYYGLHNILISIDNYIDQTFKPN